MRAILTIILVASLWSPSVPVEAGGGSGLVARVNLLIDKRQTAEAKKLVDQALRKNRRDPQAHFSKAKIYVSESKINEGVNELHQAIKLDPRNAEAYYLLGILEFTRGHQQEAADAWREAMKYKPSLRHAKDCKCGSIDSLLKQYPPRKNRKTN